MATYEILSPFPSGDKRKSLAVLRGFAAFRKLVVVRQILEEVRNDEDGFQAFLRDAKVAAVFSHPNIADLYDLDAQENQLLLVSEFVPGASLAEVIRACRRANTRVPLEVTLRALQHAAMALHYAHTFVDPSGRHMPVVHKHFNDDALVISFDGMCKVTDFSVPQGSDPETETDPFRAPEYGWGDQLDARADVFALGMILQRALQEIRSPNPGALGSAVPPALESIVTRATARTREQRFATALEFARACEAAAGRGWDPAQLATFMQRLFKDRRAKMADLVNVVEVKETTAVMKLSEIFEGATTSDANDAISEATRPGHKSPFYAVEEEATNPAAIPPPTIGVAAVANRPTAPVERGLGLRLGRALLKLILWVVLLTGAFSAGAYVTDAGRATQMARQLLQRGAEILDVGSPKPEDTTAVAAVGVAADDDAGVAEEAPDGGVSEAMAVDTTLDAGTEADAGTSVDAGTSASRPDAGTKAAPKKKKRRR